MYQRRHHECLIERVIFEPLLIQNYEYIYIDPLLIKNYEYIYIDPLLIKSSDIYKQTEKHTSAARQADTSRHKSVITIQIWFDVSLLYGWK